MKRFLSLLLFVVPLGCYATGIRISSQEEFDSLGKNIRQEISKGEERIDIDIMPGHYFFDEGHITLEGVNAGKVHLTIKGHDAVLTGRGSNGAFNLEAGFVNLKKNTDVPYFTKLRFALAQAELLDAETGLWRIAAQEKSLKESKASDTYILITQWYLAKYYRVVKIEDGYIYFMAPGSEDSNKADKSPNSDYYYGHTLPRYALVNAPSSKEFFVKKNGKVRTPSRRDVVRCDAATFMSIIGGTVGTVNVSGLSFLGAGAGKYSLLELYRVDVRNEINVSNCSFEGIRGTVTRIIGTKSVHFVNNVVKNCYSYGLFANPETKDIVVRGNKFYNNGLSMSNYFCVVCRGEDFLIADNYFEDFVYSAIGVGIWYKTEPPHNCSGVVENNECCQSAVFSSRDVPFNLMDSGAIYTWTINKDVIIRNNYVHDISGPKDNRGIFCDDGTINVTVVGNRVERISNSYCIDLRRVTFVETAVGTQIKKANVGNIVKDNMVDGKIRFQQRED